MNRFFEYYRGIVKRKREGSLLMVSMIVLSVITLSTIFLSTVLLQEIRSTRYADQATSSYYAAESGAEAALWRLHYAKDTDNPGLFTSLQGTTRCAAETGLQSDLGCVPRLDPLIPTNPAAQDAGSDAERTYEYVTVSLSSPDFTAHDIQPNIPVIMDIYDPTQAGIATANTNISQLFIDWSLESCGSASSAKLEVTYTPIVGSTLKPEESTTRIGVCGCSTVNAQGVYPCTQISIGDLSPTKFYHVVYRSIDSAVSDLNVRATDSGGASAEIPSQVSIASRGSFRDSRSTMTTRAVWKDVVSGVFGYVLFSEQSLIKDTRSDTSSAFPSTCGICSGNPANPIGCSSDTDCPSGETCSTPNAQAFCHDDNPPTETFSSPLVQNNEGSCNTTCTGYTYCGDSTVQTPNGAGIGGTGGGNEECDNGPSNSNTLADHCRTSCVNPKCGDGVVDTQIWDLPNAEQCDDGNTTSGDGCSATCTLEGNFKYQRTITLSGGGISSTLSNVPILVHLTSGNFGDFDKVKLDGSDIRFYSDSAGTQPLYYEIERWSQTEAWVWVRVSSIDGSGATIYMRYSDPDAQDAQTPRNVWDTDFIAVHHLNAAIGNYYDSTINANDSISMQGVTRGSTGKIGKAITLSGAGSYVDLGNRPSVNFENADPMTFEAWISSNSANGAVIAKMDPSSGYRGYDPLYVYSKIRSHLADNWNSRAIWIDADALVTNGSWHYLTATYDGSKNASNMKIYVDGVLMASTPCDGGSCNFIEPSTINTFVDLKIGSRDGGQNSFTGQIDEVRISKAQRTPDWIKLQFESMSDALASYGARECLRNCP